MTGPVRSGLNRQENLFEEFVLRLCNSQKNVINNAQMNFSPKKKSGIMEEI